MKIVCGINPVYYYINDENEFYSIDDEHPDEQDENIKIQYQLDEWRLSDESKKGFAVIKNETPLYNITVGDLIAINSQKQEWSIGVIRWLMISDGQEHKIGIELLSKEIETAAIRAVNGSEEDTRFRRALLLKDESTNIISVISSKGMFIQDRPVELLKNGMRIETRTEKLLESTGGFEHYQVSE